MKMSMKLINLVEFCIMSIAEMEFVALSDTLLNLLAREDPDLKKNISTCVSNRQVTYRSLLESI